MTAQHLGALKETTCLHRHSYFLCRPEAPESSSAPLISSVPPSQWDSWLSQGIDAGKNLGDRELLTVQIRTQMSQES